MRRFSLFVILVASWTTSVAASDQGADSTAIIAVVESFHRALAKGDGPAAMALLAPDAMILESGEAQTREEYERAHLREDIEFARAVPGVRSAPTVRQEGPVAWTTMNSEAVGSFKGRAINSKGTELMVLTQTPAGWRIRAIHWSSHSVRSK